MARVYHSTKVEDEKDPDYMDAYPLKIEAVRFCEKAFGEEDGLFLELRKYPENKLYYYGLVGKNIHDSFKGDVNVGKFEELVGRYIIGYINEDKSTLQSLLVMTHEKELDKKGKKNPNTK
jgi:hypothetical protein